jgi:hypothetical protein
MSNRSAVLVLRVGVAILLAALLVSLPALLAAFLIVLLLRLLLRASPALLLLVGHDWSSLHAAIRRRTRPTAGRAPMFLVFSSC